MVPWYAEPRSPHRFGARGACAPTGAGIPLLGSAVLVCGALTARARRMRRLARLSGWQRRLRCHHCPGDPRFSFGLIADVQYADTDDAYNFSRTRIRRYRQSKRLWERAVESWLEEEVDFIVQLGDFIDGLNRGVDSGLRMLSELLRPLEGGPPVVHLLGNHELYNFSRSDMEAGIEVPGLSTPFRISTPAGLHSDAPERRAYYSFRPCEGWRVLVLDPYDISIIRGGGGRPGQELEAHDLHQPALRLCQAHNANDITKSGFALGLARGPSCRWVPLNGSLGDDQLRWLRGVLWDAHAAGERVLVLSHVVLHPNATPNGNGITLLWNYEEVLRIFHEAPAPPVAVFCGHAHVETYTKDDVCGTHHFTLPSPLEVPPGQDPFFHVEGFADGSLRLHQGGLVRSVALGREVVHLKMEVSA